MKNTLKYVLFFSFWSILIGGMYYYGKIKRNELEKYREIAIGTITDYGFGGSGTIVLHYSFNVEGKTYFGTDGMRIRSSYYQHFVGKQFPVIFSRKNPNNHGILMTPYAFKAWNIQFPDSLAWVTQYEKF